MRRLPVAWIWCHLLIVSSVLAAPQDPDDVNNLDTVTDSERTRLIGHASKPLVKPFKYSLEEGVKDSQEAEYDESNEPSELREDPRAAEGQSTTQKQVVSDETGTPTTITTTRPTKKPNKKPKPARATTTTEQPAAQTETSSVTAPVPAPTAATATPVRRYPCRCGGGLCSCCTGLILENFNVPLRSRACANVTYDPDEFAFNFKLLYNDRLLYSNRMSAKNPPPACITVNRYFGIKMCAKMTNVFLSGRNVHACLELEGFWDDEPTFNYPFNCFRFGSEGVAFVRPEDGGGLPPPPDEEEQTDEDYDDSARGWTADVWAVPN